MENTKKKKRKQKNKCIIINIERLNLCALFRSSNITIVTLKNLNRIKNRKEKRSKKKKKIS